MITFPNAKLNLGLNIVAKRTDGFHDICTVFYPVPLCDILEIIPSQNGVFHFESSGIPVPGKTEDNLCVRAWSLLHKTSGIPAVNIHLHKVIPQGAGLGGGSSDAAFTLLLLNQLFGLKPDKNQISTFASQLGSDCAFFVHNIAVLARGRGDEFEDISFSLKGFHLVLVKPAVSVNTSLAYSLVHPQKKSGELPDILKHPPGKWKDKLINDFELPVFNKFPELKSIKKRLYSLGADYASMSGSGSAIYGIFSEPQGNIKGSFPGCFVWTGIL
jgi:4-diphosphocytidyl-2-C-methyl-D-erythritol kinase